MAYILLKEYNIKMPIFKSGIQAVILCMEHTKHCTFYITFFYKCRNERNLFYQNTD